MSEVSKATVGQAVEPENEELQDDLSLADVVWSIRSANMEELSVLGQIAQTLADIRQGMTNRSDLGSNQHQDRGTRLSKADKAPIGERRRTSRKVPVSDRDNEMTLTASSRRKRKTTEQAVTTVNNAEAQSTAKQPVTPASKVYNQVSQDKAAKQAAANDGLANEIRDLSKSVKGLWSDEQGRVRRQNGQLASKEESTAYNSAKKEREQREQNKNQSLLMKLVTGSTSTIKGAGSLVDAGQGDATDAVGAAAGGSFFYAAKEVFELSKETIETASNVKERAQEFSMLNSVKNIFKRGRSDETQAESTPSQKADGRAKESANLIQRSKNAEQAAQSQEVIKEQTESQKQNNIVIVDHLDDIENRIKSLAGDDSLFGDLLNDRGFGFGDKNKRRRRGRSRGRGQDFDFDYDYDYDNDKKSRRRGRSRSRSGRFGRGRFGGLKSIFANGVEAVERNSSFGSMFKTGSSSLLKSGGSTLLKAGGSLLTKAAAPLAFIGAAADKYSQVKDRTDLSTGQKAAQVGTSTLFSGGGAIAGGAAGAAIGSVVPVVGTVIGGVIGSILGGMGGSMLGDSVGEAISDSMADKANPIPIANLKTDSEVANSQVQSANGGNSTASSIMSTHYANAGLSQNIAASMPVSTNQSVKTLQERQSLRESVKTPSTQASVVSLDAKSLRALQGSNTSSSTSTTTSTNNQTNNIQNTASSIPTDFRDRTLQRQAADLE